MNQDLLEISDGRLYEAEDMVKVGCHDCVGCSKCCCDMGQSIKLDPYDVFMMTKNLGMSFEQLLASVLELHVEEGLLLPNLKMQGEGTPVCAFLNEEGRCSIHTFRPGLCRLFPLGRNYEENKLEYFLLSQECDRPNKTKMKVSKWIGIPNIRQYQKFLIRWHDFTKKLRIHIMEHITDEERTKRLNMMFLQLFYLRAYETEDFYGEFEARLEEAHQSLK